MDRTSGKESLEVQVQRLQRIVDAMAKCTARQYTTEESKEAKLFLDKVYIHNSAWTN